MGLILIDDINERMLPVINDPFYQLCAALNPGTFTATDAATPLSAVLMNAARVYYDASNPAGAPALGPPADRTIRKDDGPPRKKTALWKRQGASHPGHMTTDHIAVVQCKKYMSDVANITYPFGLGASDFW